MVNRTAVGLFLLAIVTSGIVAGGISGPHVPVRTPSDASNNTIHASGPEKQLSATTCNFSDIYRDVIDSVVSLRVATETGQFSQGSGFVFDADGHIVTNQHVVANGTRIEVRFDDGEWRTATVVGTDVLSDLAVLRVTDAPLSDEPLPVAETPPEPGVHVAAFGNPFGLQGSITQGIVSGVDRSMPTRQGYTIPDTIQTDAAINPGNSGGPLVDCSGRVVGVNRAASGENVGFAISGRLLMEVVPTLIESGSYQHATLGVDVLAVSPMVAEANDLDSTRGVLVVDVAPGSPASDVLRGSITTEAEGGVQIPTGGDVILSIDGRPVDSREDLTSYVLTNTRPGDSVELTVLRDGDRTTVTVIVGGVSDP